MPKGGAPGQLQNVSSEKAKVIISSLNELYLLGKPETNEQVKDRIDTYFQFCSESGLRPGIESLSLALGVRRETLYRWRNGIGCDAERQEIVCHATDLIHAYLEQAGLQGQLSPPTMIFLAKNWMGYKDSVSIEQSLPSEKTGIALSADELPRLDGIGTGNKKIVYDESEVDFS